jgi:hypothetical protein
LQSCRVTHPLTAFVNNLLPTEGNTAINIENRLWLLGYSRSRDEDQEKAEEKNVTPH